MDSKCGQYFPFRVDPVVKRGKNGNVRESLDLKADLITLKHKIDRKRKKERSYIVKSVFLMYGSKWQVNK